MKNKPFSKKEIFGLVKAVFKISFLIVGIRVLLILLTTGWSNTIERWPVELGFLVLVIVLMSFIVAVGVYTDHSLKKNDDSKDNSKRG